MLLSLTFAVGIVRQPTLVGRSVPTRAGGTLTVASAEHALPVPLALRGGALRMDAGVLAGLGAAYSAQLTAWPIATQSVTSAATFALSDAAAQRIAPPADGRDPLRTLVTALIGLLYFGPALHYYLRFVYSLFPGTGLRMTLYKTLFGQLGFGPVLTCALLLRVLPTSTTHEYYP